MCQVFGGATENPRWHDRDVDVLERPLLAPVEEESAPLEDGERSERESTRAPPHEVKEMRRPSFGKNENQPSSQEVQDHMKTHIPYR